MITQSLVAGVKTNAAFLHRLITHGAFLAGGIDTGFIERHLDELTRPDARLKTSLIRAGALHEILRQVPKSDTSPWSRTDGWQLGGERQIGLELEVDGEPLPVLVSWKNGKCAVLLPGDNPDQDTETLPVSLVEDANGVYAASRAMVVHIALAKAITDEEAAGSGAGRITAPMPGKILQMGLAKGQNLAKGETLIILEAMKMEHALKAPFDARVVKINIHETDQVEEGAVLVELEPI
jgi:acetyl/propionyl-CoA carboxylase alpha subunit